MKLEHRAWCNDCVYKFDIMKENRNGFSQEIKQILNILEEYDYHIYNDFCMCRKDGSIVSLVAEIECDNFKNSMFEVDDE